jgi:hypothetical protein
MEFFYYTEHSDQRNTSVIQHQKDGNSGFALDLNTECTMKNNNRTQNNRTKLILLCEDEILAEESVWNQMFSFSRLCTVARISKRR